MVAVFGYEAWRIDTGVVGKTKETNWSAGWRVRSAELVGILLIYRNWGCGGGIKTGDGRARRKKN